MNLKVVKTISLIKKSYKQPMIFHALMNHLCFLLGSLNPLFEIKDDWSKILVYCASTNKIPNQGLETKIIALLRKMKKSPKEDGNFLKLMIILYYLKNRNVENVNHIIIWELVNHFMSVFDFTDGLIISLLNNCINSNIYKVNSNKKFRSDSVVQMIKHVKNMKLSKLNLAFSLPLYIQYDIEPSQIDDLDIQNDLLTYITFDSFCFFAKYCKNEEFLKEVVPQNEVFFESLNKFISHDLSIDPSSQKVEPNLFLEDREIYDKILEAYDKAYDKKNFKSKLFDFISDLD